MGIKLSKIFQPEDETIETDEFEVKETSKSSGKEYKNKTILVEPRAFSERESI